MQIPHPADIVHLSRRSRRLFSSRGYVNLGESDLSDIWGAWARAKADGAEHGRVQSPITSSSVNNTAAIGVLKAAASGPKGTRGNTFELRCAGFVRNKRRRRYSLYFQSTVNFRS
jgi:hypothetical protein